MTAQFVMPNPWPQAPDQPRKSDGNRPGPKVAIDFRRLVGERGWRRLDPAIRRRFAATQTEHQRKTYKGAMTSVSCSNLGLVFSQFCRLLGTPLAPYRGTDVPMAVKVYPAPDQVGIVWERQYSFPNRRDVIVRSTKIWNPKTGMIEQLDGGFSMVLQVFEKGGCLYFTSKRYYLSLLGLRIPLPLLLTPGSLEVVHAAESDDRFRFTMTIRHPFLGVTYYQDGIFHDDQIDGEYK